jgi:hypothetical protein
VRGKLSGEYRYLIDMVSIHAILTNTIRYWASIDTSGIEAEPDVEQAGPPLYY